MPQMLGNIGHHEANDCLDAQKRNGRDGQIGFSLSAMHRAAGSPRDYSPMQWLVGPARDLVSGTGRYHHALAAMRGEKLHHSDQPVWAATAADVDDGPEPAAVDFDDVMAHGHLAEVYADFVDGMRNHDDDLI